MVHLEWGSPGHGYRLGQNLIGSGPAKKNLEVLLDEKLDLSCHKRGEWSFIIEYSVQSTSLYGARRRCGFIRKGKGAGSRRV